MICKIIGQTQLPLVAEFPGGVLPYITYIGMCRCEGYGFQAVWSGIGYRNQGVEYSSLGLG